MNRPVQKFQKCMPVCREREFQISSYKSVQLQDSQVLYFTFVLFFGNLFFSSHKTISWYILAYHTSNKCEYMTLILNNRLFKWEDSKRKITCRLSSTSVTNIKCDGGEGGKRNGGIFGNSSTPPH